MGRVGNMGKVGLVLAGYAAAIGAAIAAGWFYDWRMSLQPYDTSGGMYAFGQLLTALSAFFIVSLAPTLLALWFLRRNKAFWGWIAWLSIGFAGMGLFAVLIPLVVPWRNDRGPILLLSLVKIAQYVGVPLWTIAMALFALIAPTRESRRLLVSALGIEIVIGMCSIVHWFLPRSPL